MKTALRGCFNRKGTGIPNGYWPSLGGFVVSGTGYVPWAQMQTSAAMQTANNPALQHNGQLVANNPVDQAITACQAFNTNSGAFAGENPTLIQWRLKLRVAFGISSPAWVCNDSRVGKFFAEANQGPGEVTNGNCPCFWTTQFAVYANSFEAVMVREYDGVIEIEEIVIARCSTVFTEPMIRQQIADSLYVSNANASGYSYTSGSTQTSIMTGLGYVSETAGSQRQVADAVLNSTTTLTSATAAFVAGDVGSYIIGKGIPLGTTIATRTNGTTVVLSAAAQMTLTGGTVTIMGTGSPSDQQQQLDDISRRYIGGGTWAAPTGWANTRIGYAFNPYAILPGSGKDFAFTLIVAAHMVAVLGVQQASLENNSGDPTLYPPNTGQYPTMFAAFGAAGTLNGEQTATKSKFSGVGLNGQTTLAGIAGLGGGFSTLGKMIAQAILTQNISHVELPAGFETMLSIAEVATLTSLFPTAATSGGGATIRQHVPFSTSAAATSQNIPHGATLAGSTIVIHVYGRATVTPTLSITGGGTFTARKTTATGGGGTHLACDDIGAGALTANALSVGSTQSGSICGEMWEIVGTGITYEGGTAAAPGASTGPTASYTTTQGNDVVLASIGWNSSTVTGTPSGSGFSSDAPSNGIAAGGNGSWLGGGSIASASLGAVTYAATLTGAQWWAAVITAYRVAGGAVPGQPTGVVGTPASGQATVTFIAPSNGGSAITSTLIKTYLGGVHQAGLDQTISGTGTSKVVTGLTNGTAYQSSATCTNAVGTGLESALSNPYTPAAAVTVPAAPAAPTAIALDAEAIWSWVAPNNGGAAIDQYGLTVTPTGLAALAELIINDGPPPSTIADVLGYANGQPLTATVRAHNAQGWGASSPASLTYTPTAPPTPTPSTGWVQIPPHPSISPRYESQLES